MTSQSLWAQYLTCMNCWMDHIYILLGGSLDIYDDLINFLEELIKNKMADRGQFKKWPTNVVVLWVFVMI